MKIHLLIGLLFLFACKPSEYEIHECQPDEVTQEHRDWMLECERADGWDCGLKAEKLFCPKVTRCYNPMTSGCEKDKQRGKIR